MKNKKNDQKINTENTTIEPAELNLWKTTVANAGYRLKQTLDAVEVEKVFLMAARSKLKEVERSGK